MNGAVLRREDVDRDLARLGAESDRMAQALLAMDGHAGHQFLRGAVLTGSAERRWAETSAAMVALWEQFGVFRKLLERATEIRAQRSRPNPAELAELTDLLTGPVVEVADPAPDPGLTGAAAPTRVTLSELVSRMTATYQRVMDVLNTADRVWNSVLTELDPLDEELRAVRRTADDLGVTPPELGRAAGRVTELRTAAVSDPFAPESVLTAQRVAALRDEVGRARAEVARLAELRDRFTERTADLAARLDRIGEVVAEAVRVRAEALVKIANPNMPEPADPVPALRARLDRLRALGSAGDWARSAAELAAVSQAVADAEGAAAADVELAAGLLARRTELRGRLGAYRAKAAGLGHAEDRALADGYRVAHDLLYTAPCDLRAATRAVAEYQRAVLAQTGSTPAAG